MTLRLSCLTLFLLPLSFTKQNSPLPSMTASMQTQFRYYWKGTEVGQLCREWKEVARTRMDWQEPKLTYDCVGRRHRRILEEYACRAHSPSDDCHAEGRKTNEGSCRTGNRNTHRTPHSQDCLASRIEASLRPSDSARCVWPHSFDLRYARMTYVSQPLMKPEECDVRADQHPCRLSGKADNG